MKYIMRLVAILIGIIGAIFYFFTNYSNVAFSLFALGGVILFIDLQIRKKK